MGTNIGIQLRKLYEPEYYPGAEVIPYFDSFYGSEKVNNRTRPYVCAIGFEPNHLHFERLILLQTKYRQAGYPMVVFLGTAIWIENKKLTFFQKPEANAKWNEWGSSLIKWNQHMIEQPVLGLDSAAFFHRIFTLWSNQFDRPTGCFNNTSLGVVEMGNCSRHINARDVKHKVLGKLDIEGAEYQVLPHLISHNVLCSFDELMIEFHDTRLVEQATITNARQFLDFWYGQLKTCDFKIVDLDDESYGYGEDTAPMPAPLNRFNTSKFSVNG